MNQPEFEREYNLSSRTNAEFFVNCAEKEKLDYDRIEMDIKSLPNFYEVKAKIIKNDIVIKKMYGGFSRTECELDRQLTAAREKNITYTIESANINN